MRTIKITGWAFELGPSDNAPRNLTARARSLFDSDHGTRSTVIPIEKRGMVWDSLTMQDIPNHEWPQYTSAWPGYRTDAIDQDILARFRIAKIKKERSLDQNFEQRPDMRACNTGESEATHQLRWMVKCMLSLLYASTPASYPGQSPYLYYSKPLVEDNALKTMTDRDRLEETVQMALDELLAGKGARDWEFPPSKGGPIPTFNW